MEAHEIVTGDERSLEAAGPAPDDAMAGVMAVLLSASSLAQRKALIILLMAEGVSAHDTAAMLGVSDNTVRRWRRIWPADGPSIFRGAACSDGHPAPDCPAPPRAFPDDAASRGDFGISGRLAMRAAVARIVLSQLAAIVEQEPVVFDGTDIEGVHRMRVAVRRLRCAMKVFRKFIDRKWLARNARLIQRSGAVLGAVRDIDIALAHLAAHTEAMTVAEARALLPYRLRLDALHREKRADLLRHLSDPDYREFLADTHRVFSAPEAPGEHPMKSRPGDRLVAWSAPAILYKRWSALMVMDAVMPGLDAPRLHRIRIAFKNFRYVMEFFNDVLGKEADGLIKGMRRVQESIGLINDCSTILRFIDAFHDSCALPVAPGEEAYRALVSATLAKGIRKFPKIWARFTKRRFRKLLARAIGKI